MIAWLFIGLAILAGWHYLWDAIAAPSIRTNLRFKLFGLRDEVRQLLASSSEDDRGCLDLLHSTLNSAIRLLPGLRLTSFFKYFMALRDDKDLHAKIEERIASINSASNPRVKELHAMAANAVYRALLTNSGGWLFIVAPLVLAAKPVGVVYRIISALATLTDNEMDRRFPALAKPELG